MDASEQHRMVSYNIGHLAYLNAKRYGLSRVLFGGFFIRGHPYTMETISFAIKFWSKVCMLRSNLQIRLMYRYVPPPSNRHLHVLYVTVMKRCSITTLSHT